MATMKLLILAGGKSSRMGSPKHMLPLPSGLPLYTRIAAILSESYPCATVHVSLARDSTFDQEIQGDSSSGWDVMVRTEGELEIPIKVIYDDEDGGKSDIGPAAGLLAAHRRDPQATWIVAACDYPLITAQTIKGLREAHGADSTVTCFENEEGILEPLLAIWSPEALEKLKSNVDECRLGPSSTVKDIGGNVLRPDDEAAKAWLLNVNTAEEWDKVREVLEKQHQEGVS